MKNSNFAVLRLMVLLAVLGPLPGGLLADEQPLSAEQATVSEQPTEAARPSRRSRAARKQQMTTEQLDAMLAKIPEDHPRRDELRGIVRAGPPEGFSAEEWLNLAMKFDVRTPGSARMRSPSE